MPVEIRELVIRAIVDRPGNSSDFAEESPAAHGDTDEIVQECVRQVLRILEKNKER